MMRQLELEPPKIFLKLAAKGSALKYRQRKP